ncbi:MAG: fumarylacetoacetate hydrolase family protein [Chthonomonadales bacterium]
MKLVRFVGNGEVRIGALVDEQIVDIGVALTDYAASNSVDISAFGPGLVYGGGSMRAFLTAGLHTNTVIRDAVAAAITKGGSEPLLSPADSIELLAPIDDPQKLICIGQNYKDHCEEQNQPIPERAIIFTKFATCIAAPGQPIVLPDISEQVDYEAELAFVVGKRAKKVSEADAPAYIAGYMCLNDVSARDIQMHPAEKQWIRGKSPDTFAPIGPALVTSDEIPDPHNLDISLTLNGFEMQKSNTSNLIFGINYLLSYLSLSITLEPGDIVTTGTPGGVGVFRNPQVFLKEGDVVDVIISRIGTLTNPVIHE